MFGFVIFVFLWYKGNSHLPWLFKILQACLNFIHNFIFFNILVPKLECYLFFFRKFQVYIFFISNLFSRDSLCLTSPSSNSSHHIHFRVSHNICRHQIFNFDIGKIQLSICHSRSWYIDNNIAKMLISFVGKSNCITSWN